MRNIETTGDGAQDRARNVLLVYPEYPKDTYWNFGHAMPIIGRKASMPPLGLITVAAMLPSQYRLKLVDMNIEALTDEHLAWADVVFTSTMVVQNRSFQEVVERAKAAGVPVVAGGPHPTTSHDTGEMEGVTHLVLGEAENVLGEFLSDFEQGRARASYRASSMPEVCTVPLPRFDLLRMEAYGTMCVQYSRGCPFMCEFCDIWQIYGRRPRVKEHGQLLRELDALYELGWRGAMFIVDDNFIGNVRLVKNLLPHLETWQRERGFPFRFFTEASVNLAHHEDLLDQMRDAGFNMVFLGIETPSLEGLKETKKSQNLREDLLGSVEKIQKHGLEVTAGFIVGFDSDAEDIFERQIRFIQQAGIPMAMVGILTALRGTELYERMKREGRLLCDSDGNNTHSFEPNFVPRMATAKLSEGYKRILATIYDRTLRNYYHRCRTLLDRLGPNPWFVRATRGAEVRTLFRALRRILTDTSRTEFLKFTLWSLWRHPRRFAEAVRLGVMGYHFRLITQGALGLSRLKDHLRGAEGALALRLAEAKAGIGEDLRSLGIKLRALYRDRRAALKEASKQVRALPAYYRAEGKGEIAAFSGRLETSLRADVIEHGLARLRESIRSTEEDLRTRWASLRESVGGVGQAWTEFKVERAEKLGQLKQRIKMFPRDVRLAGWAEYRGLMQRLDEMFALELAAGG
ncbi:MAG: B12-binding domain-containing radical SAM protein [Nitrospirae bacterium]|nr:B12-binding domain-containing radical SAM protein [Nitrospirota bacterium]